MVRRNTGELRAGDLRQRISFLARRVTVQSGKTTERWETLSECWARAEPLKGREYFEAAAVNREDTVRFTIRYRTDISAEMTLRFRGVDYNIESIINPDFRNAMLEILARSVVKAERSECWSERSLRSERNTGRSTVPHGAEAPDGDAHQH